MSTDNNEVPIESRMKGRKLRVGNTTCVVGRRMYEMKDSTEFYEKGDFKTLKSRLDEDGFILVRGAIGEKLALRARRKILSHIDQKHSIDHGSDLMEARIAKNEDTHRLDEGYCVDAETGGVVGERDHDYDGWREVGNSDEVRDVYAGERLNSFYEKLWGQQVHMQTEFTWLRMKGRGDSTIEHADYYYFKRSTDFFRGNREFPRTVKSVINDRSKCTTCNKTGGDMIDCSLCDDVHHKNCVYVEKNLSGEWHCNSCADSWLDAYTCWVALGDVHLSNGMLAVVPGTHVLKGYDKPTKKNHQLPDGYNTYDKEALWYTTEMKPGDIILFNIKLVHGASANVSHNYRVSLDTRVVVNKFNPKNIKRNVKIAPAHTTTIPVFFKQSKKRTVSAQHAKEEKGLKKVKDERVARVKSEFQKSPHVKVERCAVAQ